DCLANATTEEVLALCQAVIDAQSAEIEQMQAWLSEWYDITYAPMSMLAMMEGMAGHNHAAMVTDPPMMMGMMAGFNRAEGIDYDILWLESMINHHDDALHMSERWLTLGVVHPDLGALAQ